MSHTLFVALTPVRLRKIADADDPALLRFLRDSLQRAAELSISLENDGLQDVARSLDRVRDVDLAGSVSGLNLDTIQGLATEVALAVGSLGLTFARDPAGDLAAARTIAANVADGIAADLPRSRESALALALRFDRVQSLGRKRTAARDRALALDLGLDLDRAHVQLGEYLEFMSWVGSILYVTLGVPYTLGKDSARRAQAGTAEAVIADLEFVPSLGETLGDAVDLRGEVENLIGKLHQVAHDDATEEEMSLALTQHAKDGHRLFFGSDGGERDIPPRPASVHGWLVDAVALLEQDEKLEAPAQAFVDDLLADSGPSGFRDALNKQLVAAAETGPDPSVANFPDADDRRGESRLAQTAERLGGALSALLTPDQVTNAVGVGWWLSATFRLGPGSWLLSTLVISALLMRRK